MKKNVNKKNKNKEDDNNKKKSNKLRVFIITIIVAGAAVLGYIIIKKYFIDSRGKTSVAGKTEMKSVPQNKIAETAPHGDGSYQTSKFTSSYSIDVAGFKGILNLYTKNGKPYGTIRFPSWGRGAAEALKKMTIKNSQIRFTRSVTTPQEKKRTGSPRYFTQNYFGKYSKDGKIIKGYYNDAGAEVYWTAKRQ